MNRVRHGRRRAAVVVLALAASLLAACGSTGTAGTGVVTPVGGATAAQSTLTDAQVDALFAQHTPDLKRAVKAFRKCDRKVARDSYVASPCLSQVMAETAAVNSLRDSLSTVTVPAARATTVRDLKALASAGALVAKRCAKANDQKCDQALARFRADEQSLLWDLDIQL